MSEEQELSDDKIYKLEKYIPRFQLIFSEYSPLMALDQLHTVDENSEYDSKIRVISHEFYYIINFDLVYLMDKYKLSKTMLNIVKISNNCREHLGNDAYNKIFIQKQTVKPLENCWYWKQDWFKERQMKY